MISLLADFNPGLDRLIRRMLSEAGIPGAAVAITQRGQDIIGTHGVTDAEAGEPIGPDTSFDIGSCSKAYVATAIALLASRGRLGLDDPVTNFLPDFELDDDRLTSTVAIRDLLSNRIGLRRQIPVTGYANADISAKDILRRVRGVDRVYPFRQGYVYFNPGFMACALVIERITGMSYANFLEKELCAAIGQTHTTSGSRVAQLLPGRATGHTLIDGQAVPLPGPVYNNLEGAGAVYSSAMDAVKWMKFHLAVGRVGDTPLIDTDILSQTHRPHARIPDEECKLIHRPPESDRCDYCMGWWLTELHGHALLQHAGEAVGWRTMVAMLPGQQTGVSVYLSAAKGIHQAISYTVLETLMNGHSRNWIELATAEHDLLSRQIEQLAASSFPCKPGAAATVPLENLAGRYRHSACGDVEVFPVGDGFEMRIVDGRLWDMQMTHIGENVFECRLLRPEARDFMSGSWRARFEVSGDRVLWLDDPNARYVRIN